MTAKNEFEKDAPVSTTPKADAPETKRELTDEEIASVAGGNNRIHPIDLPLKGKIGPVT